MTGVKAVGRPADTTGVVRASVGDAAQRGECARALAALEDLADFAAAAPDTLAELIRAAAALGDPHLVWRARRLQAELTGRQGDLAGATEELWRVHDYASSLGHARLLAQTHHSLSWNYRDIGDLDSYLHHAVQAVEQLDAAAPAGVRALHLLRLADALDDCGSSQEALERYTEAEDFAVRHGETVRQVRCLNNRAFAENEMGDTVAAQATMARLVEVCAAHELPLQGSQLDTIARIEIGLGQYDQAVRTSRRAMEVFRRDGVPEVLAPLEYLLTQATAERCRGALEAAQECLDESRELARGAGAASVLVRLEQEQAELHAARGDWEAAYRSFRVFHATDKALQSEQRSAQSTMRLAVLRTQEARAEAEHFRAEAFRDALTGLRNRRYLEHHLPRLLEDRHLGMPLAAALLDLDHFKRVNDTCSHAAGDEVLVAVAALLEDAVVRWCAAVVGGEGFAVRLGGEEFLLVTLGGTGADLVGALDQLRQRVARHDWTPVTGALPVTVSTGVSWAGPDDSQFTLLRRADDLMYAAKRAGRDRVVHDGPPGWAAGPGVRPTATDEEDPATSER